MIEVNDKRRWWKREGVKKGYEGEIKAKRKGEV
jgi:hypothetical protein